MTLIVTSLFTFPYCKIGYFVNKDKEQMGGKIVEFVQTGTRSICGSAISDTNVTESINYYINVL